MFLDVSTTGFSGLLPNSIDNLKFLKHLGLSQCNFNGSVPASFGNLTQITELDLSSNNFVGELPSSLSNLKKLSFLNLRCNNLSGKIPSSLSCGQHPIFKILLNLMELQFYRINTRVLWKPHESYLLSPFI